MKNNKTNQSGQKQALLIPNKPSEAVRFQIPEPKTYKVFPSLLSIISLILMSGISTWILMQLKDQPMWVRLPFIFTIFGGTLGWVFELGLLLVGKPFQMMLNRFTSFIQRIRLLNIAPVVATLFFFTMSMVVPEPNLRMALLFVAVFAGVALGVAAFYGGALWIPLIILLAQLVQLIIVWTSDSPVGSDTVKYLLMAQAVLQASAFLVGTTTPLKSTGFHVISTFSGLAFFYAISKATEIDPAFSQSVATTIPSDSLLKWGLIATVISAISFTMKSTPMVYNTWRAAASNAIWSLQYFLIISAKRFPNPLNLTEVYTNKDLQKGLPKEDKYSSPPEPSTLRPYYQQHPSFLPKVLDVPSVEKIEGNVTALGGVVQKAKKAFQLIALMDHFFPQADSNAPLSSKPRMKPWSNGYDIYPQIFLKTIFGFSLPIPPLKPTPEPAIDAFHEGQLLAYLGQYGIANPFLKKAPANSPGNLIMDFRFLEEYETKPDYEPYGGVAYFNINSQKKKLELVAVIPPRMKRVITANPMDPSFRHAESMIIASMYFQVISGKHLAEIHMTYNLLEVVLHNAFDAQGAYNHPLRTFMYIHLFSHELAEEFTTEHLVQEGAVFTQVFATTYDSMVNHLNNSYSRFQYGEDENFEERKEIMTMDNGEVVPGACITWELQYAKIWRKYTDDLIETIYANDAAVEADTHIRDMHRGLLQVMLNGLPDRYQDLKTKEGLSRWASDTIHHLIVKHQVYGTTGINAAMDPRISSTQVPKDGGTQGVDEWRSLISIGLATACARFTLLLGNKVDKNGKEILVDGKPVPEDFLYLLDGVDEKYKNKMGEIFKELHVNLNELNTEWTSDPKKVQYNYDYFRAAPQDLRTGPGY